MTSVLNNEGAVGAYNIPNDNNVVNTKVSKHQSHEKTTYGRLRVLTAPPTSVHELSGSNNPSGTEQPKGIVHK